MQRTILWSKYLRLAQQYSNNQNGLAVIYVARNLVYIERCASGFDWKLQKQYIHDKYLERCIIHNVISYDIVHSGYSSGGTLYNSILF